MADPVGAAASVGGLISLSFLLFQGCVKGIEIISTAQNFNQDADRLQSMLAYEQYRLLQWGHGVGLDDEDSEPSVRLNWTLIENLLRQLERLLTDSKVLSERYNLQTITEKDARFLVECTKSERSRSTIVLSQLNPELHSARTRILSKKVGVVRKLRWAVFDENKVRKLLAEIGYFNNCLQDLLDTIDQRFVREALSIFLRELVSRTTNSAELEAVKALLDEKSVSESPSIGAAANLKQIRLVCGLDKRHDEQSTSSKASASKDDSSNAGSESPSTASKPKLVKLSMKYLERTPENVSADHSRPEIATYHHKSKGINKRVFVEWKLVDKKIEDKLKRRIQNLTWMMSNTRDPAFHSLPCLGFLCHETSSQSSANVYAYVYELQDLDDLYTNPSAPVNVTTLRAYLASSVSEGFIPSLSFRLSCAVALSSTVLQLHTSGWLHKGLCSSNVLLVHSSKPTTYSAHRNVPAVYLAGYEYARADNPLEMTESVAPKPERDLYRHPDAQGLARTGYTKAFDMYSLGCLLIEIALWISLEEALYGAGSESHTGGKSNSIEDLHMSGQDMTDNQKERLKWQTILRGKEYLSDLFTADGKGARILLDQIAFSAGDTYQKAVKLCFETTKEVTVTGDDTEIDPEVSVMREMEVVKLLRAVAC